MSERPSVVTFPKRSELLEGVKEKLSEFAGTKISLRQLYYRLVAAGYIPNSKRSYQNVIVACSKWRREGVIPIEAFEDRTRSMAIHDSGMRSDDPISWLTYFVKSGIDSARNYFLARWFEQEYRVLVAVEKQALEGAFEEVCNELDVDLAVCRGYPSLSFLNEIAQSLSHSDDRKNVVLYFGDFDPSGLDIPRVIESELSGFFKQSFEFHRIALTREQATEKDLIPAPAKESDARYASFSAEHGEEVFELDAIDPKQLQNMIREAVNEYFDESVYENREETIDAGRSKIEDLLKKMGVEKFLADLKRTGAE